MRTTVDLPPALHRRVVDAAAREGLSMSAMLSKITARGLEDFEDEIALEHDDLTGLPLLRVGQVITPELVAELIEDDEHLPA
ncbi:toxin-antitoxin system, antitoxin component [Actinomyces oricola]